MILKEKIKTIQPSDYVLEVGPGARPHPRSDIYLDRKFESDEIALSQRGNAPKVAFQKPVIYYDGGKFPFKDKEFDYVICSHVLEHVPFEELHQFILELQRVAVKGYIEFPLVFYEFINYSKAHKWFINYRSGDILLLDKEKFSSNYIHLIYREFIYGDQYIHRAFKKYKEFFFAGFEWTGEIKYKIVNDFETLINEDDFLYWQNYFKEISQNYEKRNWLKRIIYKIVMKFLD